MSLNILENDELRGWVKDYYEEFFIAGINRAYDDGIITLKEKESSTSFFTEGTYYDFKIFTKLKEYCPEFSIDNLAQYSLLTGIEILKEINDFLKKQEV